jgi:hypothetical protein
MEILRFDENGSRPRKSRFSAKSLTIIGIFAFIFGIGSAFATSTITVNGDNTVQLGQGITQVTACDSSINVSPVSSLSTNLPTPGPADTPSSGGDVFKVTAIKIWNIDNNCFGKMFKVTPVKAGSPANPSRVNCADYSTKIVDGTYTGVDCVSGHLYFTVSQSQQLISFTPGISGDDIDYITLESVADTGL